MPDSDDWENEGGAVEDNDQTEVCDFIPGPRQLKLFDIKKDGTIEYEPRE